MHHFTESPLKNFIMTMFSVSLLVLLHMPFYLVISGLAIGLFSIYHSFFVLFMRDLEAFYDKAASIGGLAFEQDIERSKKMFFDELMPLYEKLNENLYASIFYKKQLREALNDYGRYNAKFTGWEV